MRQPSTKFTVLMRGLPYFVGMLAPVLSDDELSFEPSPEGWNFSTVRKLLRAQAVYYISGGLTSRLASLAMMLQKPVVMHWVGSDVTKALAAHAAGRVDWRLVRHCRHWTEVPWTAEELATAGIKAEVVPLASICFPEVVPPLPDDFRILSYLGRRPQFYGLENLQKLARDFPDVSMRVVGNCGLDQKDFPQNMRLTGFVRNMADEYAKSTMLVRMTQHDGLSFMVLEALAHGRHVVWTYPFEGVLKAQDYQSLRNHVRRLLTLHRKGELAVNDAGTRFVRSEYRPDKVIAYLRQRMKKVIEQHKKEGV